MKDKVDSPVTVLEDYFRSSDSESSSSKEVTADSESRDISKPCSRWHSFLQLLRTKPKNQMATLHPLNLSRKMSRSMRETMLPSCFIDATLSPCRSPWKIFTHHDLQVATNYFSQGMQTCLRIRFAISLRKIKCMFGKHNQFCKINYTLLK